MTMLSLAVLFAALAGPNLVYSLPSPSINLDTILEFAKPHKKNKDFDRETKYTFDTMSDNISYGSLKSQEMNEIIQKVKQDHTLNNYNEQTDYREANDLLNIINTRLSRKPKKITYSHYYKPKKSYKKNSLDDDDRHIYKNKEHSKESYFNQKALDQLLSDNVLERNYYNRPKLVPNSLVGSYENRNEDEINSDGYSKIFIVLNPEAIEKSKNKRLLTKLFKKVMSLTSSQTERKKRNKEGHYKGFSIKKGLLSRRVRRDSREIYGGKDSIEDEYKPKRIRNDRGSAGSAGGRTAIPYIKNRGDIYEKDH